MATDKEFHGRVAVVTGAASGIGRAVAAALAERGAAVAGLDRDADGLADLVRDLRAAGASALEVPADVTAEAAVEQALDRVEQTLGPVDLLVNAAGVLCLRAATDLTDEDWRRTFAVNADGVFHCSRSAVRRMLPRRRGAVVTVASNAARVPRVRMAAYCASKAAAAAYTKALGLEVAGAGIRCNVVNPGSTDTAMLRSMWTGPEDRRRTVAGDPDAFRVGIPVGRIGTVTDVVEAVLYLLSDRAGQITMHELCVDGGAALGA